MTSTKLKFRASSVEGKEGTLYLQVICRREVRRVAMPYRLFPSEWDARRGTVACGAGVRPERGRYLRAVQRAAEADLDRLRLIVLRLDRSPAPYRAADVVRQCRSRLHLINRCLRRLGERLALPQRLTSYVARHSWASIARQQRVPLAAISEAMGHTSERTTRIYLRTFDNRAVDRANAAVLRALGQGAGGGSGGAGLSARG